MEIYKGKYGLLGVKSTASAAEIYGIDGEWFVHPKNVLSVKNYYDDHNCPSIIDYNLPPGQPDYNDNKYPGMARYNEIDRRIKEFE